MSIEAMKQALEALEQWNTPLYKRGNVIKSLRQAIAEAEKQEPVAVVQDLDEVKRKHLVYECGFDWKDPLYTHPQPKREWVGLTDEEIEKIRNTPMTVEGGVGFSIYSYARMIEAKLKEKNT
jgi:hypothetical protein